MKQMPGHMGQLDGQGRDVQLRPHASGPERAQSRKGARAWTLRGSADLVYRGPGVSARGRAFSITGVGRQPQLVGCVPTKLDSQKQVGAGSGQWAAVC